jgi:hypothetical protein
MVMDPPTPPDYYRMEEAKASYNPYYKKDLVRRQQRLGVEIQRSHSPLDEWQGMLPYRDAEPRRMDLLCCLHDSEDLLVDGDAGGFLEGQTVSVDNINLFLSSSEEEKEEFRRECLGWRQQENHGGEC